MAKTDEILKTVLSNYFDKDSLKEYTTLLNEGSVGQKEIEKHLPSSVKKQLKIELPSEFNKPIQFDLLLTFAEKKLSRSKLIDLILYLGEALIIKGELNLAVNVYKYLLYITKQQKELENIYAYALVALGDIYSRQAMWKESFGSINCAKKKFDKQKDMKGSARCENLLGTIYGDRGELNKAKSHFEKSLNYLNEKEDVPLIGMLEINLGIINSIQAKYDNAFTFYKRALIKFEQLKDYRRIAEIRHNIGMLFIHREEFATALKEFDQSITISLRHSLLTVLSIAYLGKAQIYTQLNDYPLAEAFAEKTFEVSRQINDRLTTADVYKIKGIIERKKKHFKSSESYLLTSLRINEELENQMNLAESSYEIGILYDEMKRYKEADKYLQISLAYYKKIKDKKMTRIILDLMNEN
jgi:tetratricopeptide (TPR) repeat protein